jgi:hypothetical protein
MERIQPFDIEYVISPDDIKPIIPRTDVVDMYNPNKIIGYKTPIIDAFMRGQPDGIYNTISGLRGNGRFHEHHVRDGNAYKVQIKLNEVIAKLNEVSEKNQILEEKIVHLERQTISQNQYNTMRRLTNIGERLTRRNRNGRNRTNRRRGLSREQGQAIAENILARSN